jgi:hypothetical protein
MNYFNRVVQLMDMDMTPGINQYLWKHNLFSIVVAGGLILGFCLQAIGFNAVADTSSVIANFILRIFNIEIATLKFPLFNVCQGFGFALMVRSAFKKNCHHEISLST